MERQSSVALLQLFILLALPAQVTAEVRVTLDANRDNTLYETPMDQDGQQYEMSNGAGAYLFIGRTGLDAGFRLRRTLIHFDLASTIPEGATITYASLSLRQTKAAPGSPPAEVGLHRVLQAWGEGASNALGPEGQGILAEPGDATWFHRIYPDDLWTNPGGDYSESASTTVTIGTILDRYTWPCTQQMLEDLNFWLENPEQNHGWLVKGGELAGQSAHRFGSRENAEISYRPVMEIRFATRGEIMADGFETAATCN